MTVCCYWLICNGSSRISLCCFNSDCHRRPPLHCNKRKAIAVAQSAAPLFARPCPAYIGPCKRFAKKRKVQWCSRRPFSIFLCRPFISLSSLNFTWSSAEGRRPLYWSENRLIPEETRSGGCAQIADDTWWFLPILSFFFSPPFRRKPSAYTRDTKCSPKTLKLLSGRCAMQMTTLFQTSITFPFFPPVDGSSHNSLPTSAFPNFTHPLLRNSYYFPLSLSIPPPHLFSAPCGGSSLSVSPLTWWQAANALKVISNMFICTPTRFLFSGAVKE